MAMKESNPRKTLKSSLMGTGTKVEPVAVVVEEEFDFEAPSGSSEARTWVCWVWWSIVGSTRTPRWVKPDQRVQSVC